MRLAAAPRLLAGRAWPGADAAPPAQHAPAKPAHSTRRRTRRRSMPQPAQPKPASPGHAAPRPRTARPRPARRLAPAAAARAPAATRLRPRRRRPGAGRSRPSRRRAASPACRCRASPRCAPTTSTSAAGPAPATRSTGSTSGATCRWRSSASSRSGASSRTRRASRAGCTRRRWPAAPHRVVTGGEQRAAPIRRRRRRAGRQAQARRHPAPAQLRRRIGLVPGPGRGLSWLDQAQPRSGARFPGRRSNERSRSQAARHHDLGGVPRFLCEPIDTGPHALTEFDRTVDALRQILGAKGVMSVDELRRGIEAIPEPDYLRLSYYQKWIRSIADNLLARGVITEAELQAGARRDADARHPGPRARRLAGAARPLPYPHAALPARPHRHRASAISATSATRRTSPSPARPPMLPLYHVAFEPRAIWPDADARRDRGRDSSNPGWSPPMSRAGSAKATACSPRSACCWPRRASPTDAEIAAAIERTDRASPAQGARMVARAWTDPAFRALMLRGRRAGGRERWASRCAACRRSACSRTRRTRTTWSSARSAAATRAPCSATRRSGSNRVAYRARAIRDPAGVLAEWGTVLPAGTAHPRGGQHRRLSLDGPAPPPRGHRRLGRSAPGRAGPRGRHDRRHGPGAPSPVTRAAHIDLLRHRRPGIRRAACW